MDSLFVLTGEFVNEMPEGVGVAPNRCTRAGEMDILHFCPECINHTFDLIFEFHRCGTSIGMCFVNNDPTKGTGNLRRVVGVHHGFVVVTDKDVFQHARIGEQEIWTVLPDGRT